MALSNVSVFRSEIKVSNHVKRIYKILWFFYICT